MAKPVGKQQTISVGQGRCASPARPAARAPSGGGPRAIITEPGWRMAVSSMDRQVLEPLPGLDLQQQTEFLGTGRLKPCDSPRPSPRSHVEPNQPEPTQPY